MCAIHRELAFVRAPSRRFPFAFFLGSEKRELSFWFPGTSRESPGAKRTTAAPGDPKYVEMMAYMKDKVSRIPFQRGYLNSS